MCLNYRSETILQRLKKHVAQMSGDIHKLESGSAHKMNLWRIKQAVIFFAYESRVVDRLLGEFPHVRLCADDADIVLFSRLRVERNMLPDKHANANTGHVESVEELLNCVVDLQTLSLALVFVYTHCCKESANSSAKEAVIAHPSS